MKFHFGIFLLLFVLPVVSSKLILRWNPRFKNPWTDPDVNDFDKNTWQVAINEYTHNIFALQVFDDTTNKLADYNGDIYVKAISELFVNTGNDSYNAKEWYDGDFCTQDFPKAKGYQVVKLNHISHSNCVGYKNHQTIFYLGSTNGHMFLKSFRFSKHFAPDKRYLQISLDPSLTNGNISLYNMPTFALLSENYKPYRIELEQPLPSSVVANTPFQVHLKMVNMDGEVINSSLNSGLEIMIQVSFIHKWFERKGGLWLAQTDVVLGGPKVITSVTNDQVIFTNFVKGRANVTLQLEDIHDSVELNFTSKFHVHSYRRHPDNEWAAYKNNYLKAYNFEWDNVLTDPRSNDTHIKYQHFENNTEFFRGVKIANVSVTAQIPNVLRIVPNSKAKLKSVQKVFRQFKPPLLVELLDVNGNRVTSGPDSSLEVTPSSDVHRTVFSLDASFNLYRGVGIFMGSITKKLLTTRVRFTVQSSAGPLVSDYTSMFMVNDVLHIGLQASVAEYNSVGAVKIYYIDSESPLHGVGYMDFYTNTNTGADMLDWFDFQQDMKFYVGTTTLEIAAIIGPRDVEYTDVYIGIAGAYGLPIYNYMSTQSKYSDKTRYPNFVRFVYSDQYQYLLLCNFLKSRRWLKVLVVASIYDSIPDDFVFCSSEFGIQYEQVLFPMVDNNSSIIPDNLLTEFFDEIKKEKLSIILSFVSGDALNYLVAEVTKKRFALASGYLWIGTTNMYNDFPYNNEGRCQGLTELTCVEAFRGTIILEPYYVMHGFKSRNWVMFKSLYTDYVNWKFDSKPSNEPLPTGYDELLPVALTYDAAQMFALSFAEMGRAKMTLTQESFLSYVPFASPDFPISGDSVLFDKNLDRTNYTACLYQIDPAAGATSKFQVLKRKKLIKLGEDVTPYNILTNNTLTEIWFVGQSMLYRDVPDSEQNILTIKTMSGRFNEDDELRGSLHTNFVTEKVPPDFYCTGGCGGKKLYPDNHMWQNGNCVKNETCECHVDADGTPLYAGHDCSKPFCKEDCIFGTCEEPNKCVCNPGFVHSSQANDCKIPTCLTYGCNEKFGECRLADFCKCKPGYYGKSCASRCDCGKNGMCNDGENGTGQCHCDSGYIGTRCTTHLAVAIVPPTFFLIVAFVLLFMIGKKKYKQFELQAQLMNTEWMADWDRIRLRHGRNQSSMRSLGSMFSKNSVNSSVDESDDDEDEDEESDYDDNKEKIVSRNQATWNGQDVVLKMLRKEELQLTEELRWEIKDIRDMKHQNLCLFVGACIDEGHICILNEVCGKGSLKDILSLEEFELGWDFRYSMLKDICRGMQYLHSTGIGSHGRLKSSNCLVDNRWAVKLSDFGLKNFKANQEGVPKFYPINDKFDVKLPEEEELELCDYYNLLWTAPEIIATGVTHPDHVGYGTKQGDVYSFGIILVEMCTRNHPYHEISHLGPNLIVQMVGRLIKFDTSLQLEECKDFEQIPLEILRPEITDDELPEDAKQSEGLYALIGKCWNHDPLCRPTFKGCLRLLNRISPHRGELMDNLILLMEQYTTSLEAIVAERTSDVVAEKEKGDLLLSKMLPPLIGEELKLGKNPKPEFFNSVTIYFSDCVGFGKICSDATPYDVVGLLNDLYSVMDDIIESFDCYKVETIGDCYVVASGLPIRNGDNHAGEIASMALKLMTTINGVSYKHIPGSQVQLRVGINSGSIVAGVVGLRMPRYCLFGDTMNTASRMESGGFALKIHMSEDTCKVLNRLGGYQFESRGERQVKGRGLMKTYWLLGKDDSDYKLPPESLALSASQHNFK